MIEVRNYIRGEWISVQRGHEVEVRNPADQDEIIGKGFLAFRGEAEAALAAAGGALPSWSRMPAPNRGEIVEKAADLLRAEQDDVARLLTREEGKTVAEAKGEIYRAYNVLNYTAGQSRRMGGITIPSELPKNFAYTIRQPLGVVALITPWNFPACIPAWKIAPALVAGNTVVFKPSSTTPLTAAKLVDIFERAGLPAGVLNLLVGSSSEVGDILTGDRRVRGISLPDHRRTALRSTHPARREALRRNAKWVERTPLSYWKMRISIWLPKALSPERSVRPGSGARRQAGRFFMNRLQTTCWRGWSPGFLNGRSATASTRMSRWGRW